MPQRSPRSAEISAALGALGVYAQAPCDQELEQQAIAAGGENVLAAILANALYGAAIDCGMLAEGQMQLRAGATRTGTRGGFLGTGAAAAGDVPRQTR